MAAAGIAARARDYARGAVFGLMAAAVFVMAIGFASVAGYHYLAVSHGSATAASIVAALLAGVGAGMLGVGWVLVSGGQKSNPSQPLANIVSADTIQAYASQADRTIRQIGPVKVSLLALAAGFIIGRR